MTRKKPIVHLLVRVQGKQKERSSGRKETTHHRNPRHLHLILQERRQPLLKLALQLLPEYVDLPSVLELTIKPEPSPHQPLSPFSQRRYHPLRNLNHFPTHIYDLPGATQILPPINYCDAVWIRFSRFSVSSLVHF
jgi:hypothetical protein